MSGIFITENEKKKHNFFGVLFKYIYYFFLTPTDFVLAGIMT